MSLIVLGNVYHVICKHGNLIEYRKGLIKRIGIEKVEFLERNDHEPLKLTTDEIKAEIKKYKKLILSL